LETSIKQLAVTLGIVGYIFVVIALSSAILRNPDDVRCYIALLAFIPAPFIKAFRISCMWRIESAIFSGIALFLMPLVMIALTLWSIGYAALSCLNKRSTLFAPAVFFLAALATSSVSAREYGTYDTKRLVIVSDAPTGKKYEFNVAYCDQILNDLSVHAKNYPPQFDNPQDKQRATQDAKALSGILELLMNTPSSNPELLTRAAFANSIGHNLGIPGAAEKADSNFQKLLAANPSDPRGNYMYGVFLAGAGKPKDALPYLEKALSLGVIDAAYGVGMTYLALGDKEQALKNLEDYKRRKPSDGNVDQLIDAIRNGKIEIKRGPA
jgi:tetratricopeptide (TPR) repeat protein